MCNIIATYIRYNNSQIYSPLDHDVASVLLSLYILRYSLVHYVGFGSVVYRNYYLISSRKRMNTVWAVTLLPCRIR